MDEFGGLETGAPSEGATSAPEQLSEAAKQRFAGAAAAMKAIQREEKRSKKRDSRVARTIVQFLSDERYTHLFVLISRLVARDCPSIFILTVLSLISDDCLVVVSEYLEEMGQKSEKETTKESLELMQSEIGELANVTLVEWITRIQMVLALEPVPILTHIMLDEHNIDGTVLQLATFVFQEFYSSSTGGKRMIPFEKLQVLTASILQAVFEPFMDEVDSSHFRKDLPIDEE